MSDPERGTETLHVGVADCERRPRPTWRTDEDLEAVNPEPVAERLLAALDSATRARATRRLS
ncbi:MAG: hypothetical protein HOV79_00410 [Hamadaea sp.]|nr:hypothetical protein [Hamadaea sp.]